MAFGDQLGSFFGGIGEFVNALPPQVIAGVGNAILPGNPFGGGPPRIAPPTVIAGMAANQFMQPMSIPTTQGPAPGALGQLGNLLLPGDPFGTGSGIPASPFRTTAAGNSVAQAFVTTRPNGSAEWFIPAGKPTAWSKASVKKRRNCRPR